MYATTPLAALAKSIVATVTTMRRVLRWRAVFLVCLAIEYFRDFLHESDWLRWVALGSAITAAALAISDLAWASRIQKAIDKQAAQVVA